MATLNREGRLLEERSKVDDFGTGLVRGALKGDRAPVDNLQAIAEYAAMQRMVATRAKPEVFRFLADAFTLWPVMASTNPRWVRTAEQALTSVNFEAETLHAKVKPALAFDQQVPARRRARQAIETLELNRERFADRQLRERVSVLNHAAIRFSPVRSSPCRPS